MPKVTAKRVPSGTQLTQNGVSDDETASSSISGTQVSGTQAERSVEAMEKSQVEQLVNELVTYLLVTDKNKVPIKRQDINKNVLKDYTRAFPALMSRAKAKLEKVFGIKVVELEQNRYILVNNVTTSSPEDFEEEDSTKRGLLMIILAFILLDGHQLGEDKLLENLRKLGVDGDQPHDVFGDVRQLINEQFVRQLYLDCEKQTTVDPPKITYRWGARAHAETTEQDVLDFITSVCGKNRE